MACPSYLPEFQDQIPPHLNGAKSDRLGAVSCTCYSAAIVGDASSCGTKKPSGAAVRGLCRNPDGSRDVVGGTNLNQVDLALRSGWGINLATRYRHPFDDVMRRVKAGQPAILQGGYEPIRRSRFRGSEAFSGGHAIALLPSRSSVPAAVIGADPLCDGRRPGLYRYQAEAYPESLLREYAAELVLSIETGGRKRKVGNGWAYVAFGTDIRPKTWRAGFTPGPFRVYRIVGGRAQALTRQRKFRRNTSAPCTAPRRYFLVGRPNETRLLVKITAGSLKGMYVAPKDGTHVLLREYDR